MYTVDENHFSRRVLHCFLADSNRYRYSLHIALGVGPTMTVILKNPSTADAQRLDPTVGKVEAWARRRGFGAVYYVNLFALRSTIPYVLNTYSYHVMVGPQNNAAILEAICAAHVIIAAWGNPNGITKAIYLQRIAEVRSLVQQPAAPPLSIVGAPTKKGFPRHGLHWNGAVEQSSYSILDSS